MRTCEDLALLMHARRPPDPSERLMVDDYLGPNATALGRWLLAEDVHHVLAEGCRRHYPHLRQSLDGVH